MNSRERALAILLVCVIVFGGGGFFGYQFVYTPWNQRKKTLANLQKDEDTKLARRAELEKQRTRLARWTSLSLPGDQETARLEYERYLTQLFNRYKIINGREILTQPVDTKSSPTIGKDPIYVKLIFKVKAYATMASLSALMNEFYRTGLMHEIRNLTIQRQMTASPQAKQDELDVRMTIEALIVKGADKRPYLLPNIDRKLLAVDVAPALFPHAPMVLWASVSPGLFSPSGLADPTRDYTALAKKNIFLGRPPKEEKKQEEGTPEWMAPRYVHLSAITHSAIHWESLLYDVYNNERIKLRDSSAAYNSFPFVRDGQKTQVVIGRVVRIDDRKMYYKAELVVPETVGQAPPIAHPDKEEIEKLIAEKGITAEDAKRVIRYDEDYWDTLLRTKALRVGFGDKNRFTVELERDSDKPPEDTEQGNPVEVLRGKVLLRDDGYVYALPEERYYELQMGQSIEDSLKKPLPREKIKELKEVAAAN
jgi:hypothetical protein